MTFPRLILSLSLLSFGSAHADLFNPQKGDKTSGPPATGTGNAGDGALAIQAPGGLCGSGLSEEDKWIERENCKKVLGGGGGGDASSSSSDSAESASGGESSGGGGGGGGGKCLQLTMATKGGGPVCCGGYDGHSEVIEKLHKKEAKNGLDAMKKACEIVGTIQQARSADSAPQSILKLNEARNAALQATQVWGFWGSAVEEIPTELPLIERYPNPLAPTGIIFDTEMCKDDDGCKAECLAMGQKLIKNSQECVENMKKMQAWFEKKRKEAFAFAADLETAIKHMGGKVGGGGPNASGSPTPSSTTIPSTSHSSEYTSRGGVSNPSGGSGASSESDDSSSGNLASVNNGSATSAEETERPTLGPDLTGLSEEDALAAIIEASGGSLAQLSGGSWESSKGGSGSTAAVLNAINHATVQVPGYASPLPAYAISSLAQSGNLPVGKNVYLLNSLSIAKEQVFMNPKTKRPDVQLRTLTAFERATRRYFGENGDRRLSLEKTERERKKVAKPVSGPKRN